MKKLFFGVILCVSALSLYAQENSSPKLRVYKNDLDKIYTVFFGDIVSRDVIITLKNSGGSKLIEEKMSGKGFSKPFGLSSLPVGDYLFEVKVDKEEYEFPITLKTREEILKGNVTVQANYPTLTVHVTSYNMVPTNIMVFTTNDDLLKIFYWEPSNSMMEKEIDLTQFEGYEVKVQIEQEKTIKLEQLIPLY